MVGNLANLFTIIGFIWYWVYFFIKQQPFIQ